MPLLLATHTQNAEIFSLKKVDANESTFSSFLLLNNAALHTASSASNFISHTKLNFRVVVQFRQHQRDGVDDCATTIASSTFALHHASVVVVKSRRRFSRRARAKGGGGRNGRRRRRRSVFYYVSFVRLFLQRKSALLFPSSF